MVNAKALVDDAISQHNVVLFSNGFNECKRIKHFIEEVDGSYHEIRVDQLERPNEVEDYIFQLSEGENTVPTLFVRGINIGGYNHVHRAYQTGQIRGQIGDR